MRNGKQIASRNEGVGYRSIDIILYAQVFYIYHALYTLYVLPKTIFYPVLAERTFLKRLWLALSLL